VVKCFDQRKSGLLRAVVFFIKACLRRFLKNTAPSYPPALRRYIFFHRASLNPNIFFFS
jgi:hypothetical protein